MKILIVRHAEPDYSIDSLTEKGLREADFLSERLSRLNVKEFYVSTMGRAKDTAHPTLKKLGREAIECDWLREFSHSIARPDRPDSDVVWDWLPEDWTQVEDYYLSDRWADTDIMKEGGIKEKYRYVTEMLDKTLAEHGYVRDGKIYRADNPSNDTIVFFCHFGVECVLLSHLLGISPMTLWHGFCALPTSVTTVITEERRRGKAYFRVNGFGDISHLYAAGEEPSFAARFCEMYDNENERRD